VTARHGIFGDCYGFVNVPQLSQEKWPDIAETAILGFHLNFGYETGGHNTDYYPKQSMLVIFAYIPMLA